MTLAEFVSPREILLKASIEIFTHVEQLLPKATVKNINTTYFKIFISYTCVLTFYGELRKQSDSDTTGFSPKTHEKLLEVAFSLLKVPLDDEDRKHANVRMPRALAQINLGLSQYKESVLHICKIHNE